MGSRNWFVIIGIIALTFFGIPIRKKKDDMGDNKVLFNDYIVKFNKTYRPNETEYYTRMENFKESLKLIEVLNENRPTNFSALYGLTVYSDMSQDEFKEMRLQMNRTKLSLSSEQSDYSIFQMPNALNYWMKNREEHTGRNFIQHYKNNVRLKRALKKLPLKIDWRKKHAVGFVHNQKTCGACWAFSTIETVESMYAIKNGTLLSLSVQEVIDCARNGNFGCEGGDSCSLLKWLNSTETKIITENIYPFTYHTQACKIKFPKAGVQIKSFSCDNFVDAEELLLEKLAYHGPVAAAVNALNWQFYLGGIIQFHCSGSSQDMNHAVQIVGYDNAGPVPYYIVRNSWGSEFGDDGYLYIAIGGNICGIANEVSSLDIA